MSMQNENGQELRRCSRCTSVKLLSEHFSKNSKGDYKKTCINCGEKYECNKCNYKCSNNRDFIKHMKICIGKLNMSYGEYKIMDTLKEMDIKYEHKVTRVKNDDKSYMHFDFEVIYEGQFLYIEYDGRQHFEPHQFGGMSIQDATVAFEKLKINDAAKDKWCADNGHKLLRVSYKNFGNIPQLITTFMCDNTSWGYEN